MINGLTKEQIEDMRTMIVTYFQYWKPELNALCDMAQRSVPKVETVTNETEKKDTATE